MSQTQSQSESILGKIPSNLKIVGKKLLEDIATARVLGAPPIIMAPSPPTVKSVELPAVKAIESPKGFFERVAEDMRNMQPHQQPYQQPPTNLGVGPDGIPYVIQTPGIPTCGNVNLDNDFCDDAEEWGAPCSYYGSNKVSEHTASKPTEAKPNKYILDKTEEVKLIKATQEAKQAYKEIVPRAAKLAKEPENTQYRDDLQALAKPIMEFASIGSSISQAALMTGGHKRTWKGVGAVAQGAMSVSASLNMLSIAGPGLSLGAVTGGIGLAVGIMSIAMSIFGDNDDDDGLGEALQAIHGAVIAVHNAVIEMHKDMIECFQRMEELLIVSVVAQLNQINSRISRLERITTQSFKELHTKELVDVVDAIKKEICGEHQLTSLEKKSYLRQLSSWIDNHSKSCIQTQSHRADGDMSKVIELLTETNLIESLPLFLSELMYIVPELKLQGIDKLPNLDVLGIACDVYIVASKRPGYGVCNTEVIKRASNMLGSVVGIVEVLADTVAGDETVCDILCRQYDHFRFTIGQVICKIRGTEVWTSTTKLCDYLKEGQDKALLTGLLDEMEVRRLCIVRLCELLGISVIVLDSKSDILCRPICEYKQGNILKHPKDTNLIEFKRCLEMGTNQNTWDSWGSPLHYIPKYGGMTMFVHLLFKTYTPTVMTGGTKCCLGDTWGVGSSPILHALNMTRSDIAVLFCANGFDIIDSNGKTSGFAQFNSSHMGNLYWWVELGGKNSIIALRIVKKMNDNTSEWNKTNLRAAYNYFKLCESGLPCSTDGFNMESLLLLTCVIGDLFPLKNYLAKTQTATRVARQGARGVATSSLSNDFLNTLIPNLGVTYMLLANDWRQPLVVEYLESLCVVKVVENGLVRDANPEVNPSTGPVWKIGVSQNVVGVVRNKLGEYLSNTELKIGAYLELAELQLDNGSTKLKDDCVLFRSLLVDVVETLPADYKYIKQINANMMLLEDGIDTLDYKMICNTLNCLNAMLSKTPGYSLSSMISNLISDIKSFQEN